MVQYVGERIREVSYTSVVTEALVDYKALVRELADVTRQVRQAGEKGHIGRVFSICHEKGSELPKKGPGRTFKGRYVFQGNDASISTRLPFSTS